MFLWVKEQLKDQVFLSRPDLEKVIHAPIKSQIDHCNSSYSGVDVETYQML